MKNLKFSLLLFLLLSTLTSITYGAEYWISMGTAEIWTDKQLVYVTKIDDQGRVLIPPTDVWQSAPFDDGIPTITNGPDNKLMILGVATINNPTLHTQKIRIARAIFTKDTLTTTSAGFIDLSAPIAFRIQTSQKPSNNVMTVAPNFTLPRAFAVAENGDLTDMGRLIPRFTKNVGNFGVTSDGKFGFASVYDGSTTTKLYLQPLNDVGKPTGLPAVGAKTTTGYSSVDVSNPLPGGYRFVLTRRYNLSPQPPTLEVNKIDALTGQRISKPRFIAKSDTTFVQNVAIDPDGHFVLYVETGPASCPPGHFLNGEIPSQRLWLQKINANGYPDGTRVLVVNCDDVPGGPGTFDVMKAD